MADAEDESWLKIGAVVWVVVEHDRDYGGGDYGTRYRTVELADVVSFDSETVAVWVDRFRHPSFLPRAEVYNDPKSAHAAAGD